MKSLFTISVFTILLSTNAVAEEICNYSIQTEVITDFRYPVGPSSNHNEEIQKTAYCQNANGKVIVCDLPGTDEELFTSGYRVTQIFDNDVTDGWCKNHQTITDQTACENSNDTWMYGHDGVDFNRGSLDEEREDRIFASASGFVFKIERNGGTGWGNYIWLKHRTPFGYVFTRYFHVLSVESNLKVCDRVRQGQLIATLGGSGGYTSHLHFMVSSTDGQTSGYYYNNPMPSFLFDPISFISSSVHPTTCLAATTCTANNPLVCNGGLRNTCEPEYKVACDLPNVVKPALGLSVPVFLEGEDIIVKGLYEYIEGACNFRVYVERDGIPLDRQCVSQIDTNCLNHKEGPWLFTNDPHTGYVFPVIQGAIQGNYRIDICAEGPNDQNRTREVCKQESDFTQQVFVAPINALNRPQIDSIPENRGDTFCAPPKYGYICKDYCIDKGLSPGQCLNGWECDCDGQCASKTFCRYNHRCNAGIKTVCTPGQCVMGMECDCSGNWLSRTHCTTGHLCHRLCQNYCKDFALNAGQCSGTYECDCDGLCRTRTHCTKNNQCGKYCEYYCFDYGLGPNQCRNGWQCDQTGECMVKNYCL